MDYDLLSSGFLRNQALAPELRSLCELVRKYRDGHVHPGTGSRRRADLQAGAKRAEALRQSLAKLDHQVLAEAMGPVRGEPMPDTVPADYPPDPAGEPFPLLAPAYRSFLWQRLAELERFTSGLARVTAALTAASEMEPVRKRRPPMPDPLVLGIERLVHLWREARSEPPRRSFKEGEFGDFALRVFGPAGLGFSEAAIGTAVRAVLTATGTPPESPPAA